MSEGGEEIVPSASRILEYLELYQEQYRELSYAIQRLIEEPGESTLSEPEKQFAALEVYQRDCATDGFASLFYNAPEMISHMLNGTEAAGATRAHSLLVRGLNELGLAPGASPQEIAEQGNRLADENGEEKLIEAFEVLSNEFDEEVQHLEDAMMMLLTVYRDKFKTFP